ncbi:MAG: putative lipid II flippase FtsW [Actinobacteria bacterium]|nr:putative lipid II flippase FtsW [Actinomycetota bacterium]
MSSVATVPERSARVGKILQRPQLPLLFTVLAMVAVGLLMVLSASSVQAFRESGSSFSYFYRQSIGAALGLVVMITLARADYRKLRLLARPMFTACIIMLVLVIVPFVGTTMGGSSRWFVVGPLNVQPSEIAKLAIIIFAAYVLESKGVRIRDASQMAVPVLPATAMMLGLVIAQPDLGTAIIIGGTMVVVLFLAGARVTHVGALAAGGMVAAVMLALARSYRRERVLSFLDPWADPLDTGYHVIQGQIAIGSGGFFGVGLGASRQKWSYVPNAHTDFIYAIIGEELGLSGTLFVLFLFLFLMLLGVRIARDAPDRFGLLIAGGITGWMGLQALINMAAISGLLPITGVPLPLISFGGSSLVLTMAAMGILLSIARRGRTARKP